MKKIILLLSIFLSWNCLFALEKDDIQCVNKKVCRYNGLPLKGLPRSYSKLYENPETTSKILKDKMKAFWPVYIFQQKAIDLSDPGKPKGWYQVGNNRKKSIGWMEAKDIMIWKQALVMAYTHPGTGDDRRNPLLMFNSIDSVRNIIESDNRKEKIKTIFKTLKENKKADLNQLKDKTGLISREPKLFNNLKTVENKSIEHNFYILPILEFDSEENFDVEAKYLKIAAANVGKRAEDEGDLITNDYAKDAEKGEAEVDLKEIKNTQVDIKFVMDITGSMGNYIAATKKGIERVVDEISRGGNYINFGLIGFSDQVSDISKTLVDAKIFTSLISKVKAKGGKDHQEEVFAGVKAAIDGSWSDNSIKVIVVVGDASSHKSNHKLSLTKMSENEIRQLANQKQIKIITVHLKTKAVKTKLPADITLAQTQFKTLASNPGTQVPAYLPVEADNNTDFQAVIKTLAYELSSTIKAIRSGDTGIVEKVAKKITSHSSDTEKMTSFVRAIVASALVEAIGDAAESPKDIVAWVFDHDLSEPEDIYKKPLSVRVLMTKKDLNNMYILMQDIIAAHYKSEAESSSFFESLQAIVTGTAKGEKLTKGKIKAIVKTDSLLPKWIESLPYKSVLMNKTADDMEAMSESMRSRLISDLEAKIELYADLLETPDAWKSLSDNEVDANNRVHPLRLTDLP